GAVAGAARGVAEGGFLARAVGDLEWLATALPLHVPLRQWENRLDLARDQLTELIEVRERLEQHDVAAELRAFQAQIPAAVNQEDLARPPDLQQQALQQPGRGRHQ